MPQYFSLFEANEALKIIRPLMDEVQTIRQKILANQPEAWPAIEKSAGNGGSKALSALVQDFDTLITLRLIQAVGCAGFAVIPAAIIRDRFEGDRMARMQSLVSVVFMVVPMLAPSLGQLVLLRLSPYPHLYRVHFLLPR